MGFGYKGLVSCRNNGWLLENMDKGLTVPKWVLINWPKILQMPQNLSVQIICPSPKVWDFDKKKDFIGHPKSVVSVHAYLPTCFKYFQFEFITTTEFSAPKNQMWTSACLANAYAQRDIRPQKFSLQTTFKAGIDMMDLSQKKQKKEHETGELLKVS